VWEEVAASAGIGVTQRGALVVARRRESRELLAAFAASPEGEQCEFFDAVHAGRRWPMLAAGLEGALLSPHELRVEPREALPKLAAWLAERHAVEFRWGVSVGAVEAGALVHAEGRIEADAVVVAAGAALRSLAPALARRTNFRACRLQMMRTVPQPSHWRLDHVLMSDLSLVRYGGFSRLRPAQALRARLEAEVPASLANGVNLIVAQAADGSLVVGDSHHLDEAVEPFASEAVDALILDEMNAVLHVPRPGMAEHWLGVYPVAEVAPLLREPLAERALAVVVTSGTGMSTAFAIGEETVAELFGAVA
jgi:FAD dependent oxidoreductase TIGR03364